VFVCFEGLYCYYGLVYALDGFDFELLFGEFVVLFGLLGCGKMMVLWLFVGFEDVDVGWIVVGD